MPREYQDNTFETEVSKTNWQDPEEISKAKKLEEKIKVLQKKLMKNQLGIEATHQEIVTIRKKIQDIVE
ncbi:unnamed protein product [Mucor circinelloides]